MTDQTEAFHRALVLTDLRRCSVQTSPGCRAAVGKVNPRFASWHHFDIDFIEHSFQQTTCVDLKSHNPEQQCALIPGGLGFKRFRLHMQGSLDQKTPLEVNGAASACMPVPWLSSLSDSKAGGVQSAEAFHEAVGSFQTLEDAPQGCTLLSKAWQTVTSKLCRTESVPSPTLPLPTLPLPNYLHNLWLAQVSSF